MRGLQEHLEEDVPTHNQKPGHMSSENDSWLWQLEDAWQREESCLFFEWVGVAVTLCWVKQFMESDRPERVIIDCPLCLCKKGNWGEDVIIWQSVNVSGNRKELKKK